MIQSSRGYNFYNRCPCKTLNFCYFHSCKIMKDCSVYFCFFWQYITIVYGNIQQFYCFHYCKIRIVTFRCNADMNVSSLSLSEHGNTTNFILKMRYLSCSFHCYKLTTITVRSKTATRMKRLLQPSLLTIDSFDIFSRCPTRPTTNPNSLLLLSNKLV
jgi:hypothetical protein